MFSGALAEGPQIAGRPVVLDGQGKLLSWAQPAVGADAAYDHLMDLAWRSFESVPLQENGLPTYFTYPRFVGNTDDAKPLYAGINWAHNPAGLNAMLTDSALEYAAYTGNETLVGKARAMMDHQLAHGRTPQDWAWSQVPFASSEPGAVDYVGGDDHHFCADGSACGRGDGLGVIEPDKVGEFGYALLQLYEKTLDGRYLNAAIRCADALARHVRAGDRERSPWPFRVDGLTGKQVREEYSSHVLGPIELFDELIRLGHDQVADYRRARGMAWKWLMAYPMQNGFWQGYFEDIAIFEHPGENPNQLTPLETARYLLKHPEMDPAWREHVASLLEWTRAEFAVDVNTHGYVEPGLQWGAEVISEQRDDMDKMCSHTARYASVLALWSEKTGDLSARERAFRSLNWASYFYRDDGVVKSSLDDATGFWFSDGYADNMRHFLKAMGSMPEWAPARTPHLLRSSSVVQSASYTERQIRYRTFDRESEEVLRLPMRPRAVHVEWFEILPLAQGGVVLRVRHAASSEVVIDF